MPPQSQRPRIPLFFAVGVGLSLLTAALKAIAAWAAEAHLYTLPWIGGFLRSIEIVELSNLVVFAILGGGIGAATVWLPQSWPHRFKLAFLAALSPFVFSGSYLMQQHLWIQRVAIRADISYREARQLTNTYLKREAGSAGFFGFYPFTTEISELPTRQENLESPLSKNPNKILANELASYNDRRADLVVFAFARVGWLTRWMYVLIAGITGLIYYFKGHTWANTQHRGNANRLAATSQNQTKKTL